MSWVVLMLLAVPFAAAAGVALAGHGNETATRGVTLAGAAATFGLGAAVGLAHLGDAEPFGHVYAATDAAGPPIELAVRVDQLSAAMVLLACTVALLVQVYSLSYLRGDPRYPSYAALVSLFTGAMVTVVVADDLWVLLVGWELMGACSYFLISHHWEREDARAGAVKAFLMTRTADLGLLFAILWLGNELGTYRISAIIAAAPWDGLDLALPAVLLVIAALGKSAQFPFHTWLPDAMPGPTPISALIHAATMVAAGVYLMLRMLTLVSQPPTEALLAVSASVTMVLGAVYALRSDDLKRVLAWSTVSQLAYMFGAVAVRDQVAALLHLLAHGAFKALLFLAAGAVIHAVGSQSLAAMGGLRQRLPDTFVTMTVGWAALAGVVPFVGFFTKDAVISGAYDRATHTGGPVDWLLLAAMLVTAVLTVAYCLRTWLLTFFGPARAGVEVHEAPATMRAVLYVLAVPTVIGGLAVAYPEPLLGRTFAGEAELFHWDAALGTTALLLLTAAVVLRWWSTGRLVAGGASAELHPTDVLYDRAVVRPSRGLAVLVRAGDREVIDAYAEGSGATARGLGGLLRLAQTGNAQSYVLVLVLGAVAVAVAAGVVG